MLLLDLQTNWGGSLSFGCSLILFSENPYESPATLRKRGDWICINSRFFLGSPKHLFWDPMILTVAWFCQLMVWGPGALGFNRGTPGRVQLMLVFAKRCYIPWLNIVSNTVAGFIDRCFIVIAIVATYWLVPTETKVNIQLKNMWVHFESGLACVP